MGSRVCAAACWFWIATTCATSCWTPKTLVEAFYQVERFYQVDSFYQSRIIELCSVVTVWSQFKEPEAGEDHEQTHQDTLSTWQHQPATNHQPHHLWYTHHHSHCCHVVVNKDIDALVTQLLLFYSCGGDCECVHHCACCGCVPELSQYIRPGPRAAKEDRTSTK